MSSYVLIFCVFIVPNIAYGNNAPVRNHEEVDADLSNQTRWVKELTELTSFSFKTNESESIINVTLSGLAPAESSLEPNDVKFLLYTRSNRNKPEPLVQNDTELLKKSPFKKNRPTIFVTHGWMSSERSGSCVLVRDAYLEVLDVNVIVIDWSEVAKDLIYSIVVAKVHKVSKIVANFMEYLSDNGYIVVTETVLVGHSLGAHVVGIAGYEVTGLPKAVFGLDPALPLFRFAGPRFRISNLDAKHVQIVHTNAGILGTNQFWGHVDFYMSGGTFQPGCLDMIECPHSRAYVYYAESIYSTQGFYGLECNTDVEISLEYCSGPVYGRMGGHVPDDILNNGQIFMVPVYDKHPFSVGHPPYGKSVEDDNSEI